MITRRAFLEGLGAGLCLAGFFDGDHATAEAAQKTGLSPNAFVHLAPDGTVTIVCHRSEMGQGVRSSVPALIADELGADLARIKVVQGDGDKKYGDQNTDGSSSIRDDYERLRGLGATARVMLVSAAARRWRVPEASCVARDHAVFHGEKKLGFGELAGDAARLPVPKNAPLRPRGELRRVGTRLPFLDGPAMSSGRAVYGADVRLPGMLYAVVARPPMVGGKLVSMQAQEALRIGGVLRLVELPQPKAPWHFQPQGGIAVVARDTWAAMRGRAALAIQWSGNTDYDSQRYRETLLASVRAAGKVVRQVGDVDAALAGASRRVEAEYYLPHLAHTSMEPPACVARVEGERCELWAPTQDPQTACEEVGKALGIPQDNVTLHVTLLGGGFGRKSKPDFIVEAALVSKAMKAPVCLQWTREDDVRHDYYHSVSAQRMVAGLDGAGRLTAWLHRTAFPSISSTFANGVDHASEGELQQGVLDFPVAVANLRAENGAATAHTRIGWLRSVHNIHAAFAIGSFIDELAAARGRDPREVLLETVGPARQLSLAELGVKKLGNYGAPLEKHPIDVGRLRTVIERVTAAAGWDKRKGRALGLAAHRSFLSYVAVVASVVKDERGRLRVDEVWVAADAGTVVNLERVESQLEGAVIFGMSLALHGEITMKNGAVEQSNFRDYRLVRIGEAPRQIHIDVVSSSAPPGGVGEPGVPPVAPAIANAVFALTGTRVRSLPIARQLSV